MVDFTPLPEPVNGLRCTTSGCLSYSCDKIRIGKVPVLLGMRLLVFNARISRSSCLHAFDVQAKDVGIVDGARAVIPVAPVGSCIIS